MPEIVEPKLPPYQPDIGKIALSAFATAAAINQRKAQLQQNLMELDLRNRQMAEKEHYDKLNYELDLKKLDFQHQYQTDEIAVRNKEQDRLAKALEFQKGMTDQQRTEATRMMSEINSLKDAPDSQDWRNNAYNVMLQHPGASLTPEYALMRKRVEHSMSNPAVKSQQSLLDQAIKASALDPKSAYRALNHPDQYTQPVPGDDTQIGIYVGEKPRSAALTPIDASVTPSDAAFAKKTEHVKGVAAGGTQVPVVQVNPTQLYVPVKKSRWEAIQKTFQSLGGTNDGTARAIVEPGQDQHQMVWKQARTALSTPGYNPAKVRNLYKAKGFDPSELDSDTPP